MTGFTVISAAAAVLFTAIPSPGYSDINCNLDIEAGKPEHRIGMPTGRIGVLCFPEPIDWPRGKTGLAGWTIWQEWPGRYPRALMVEAPDCKERCARAEFDVEAGDRTWLIELQVMDQPSGL